MGIFFFAIILASSLGASSTSVNLKNGDYAILVGKNDGILRVLKKNKQEYDTISEFFVSYGQKDGSKAKEGDNKTPEGVYFATAIKTKHDLQGLPEEIYGTYAVPLNYPNPIDKQRGDTGFGIWLHGTDSEEKLSDKNITKGCIIMENTNITQLVKLIRIMKTPVVIIASLKDIKLEKNDTDRSFLVFNSGPEKYKVTIDTSAGLEKNAKVLYEGIK